MVRGGGAGGRGRGAVFIGRAAQSRVVPAVEAEPERRLGRELPRLREQGLSARRHGSGQRSLLVGRGVFHRPM